MSVRSRVALGCALTLALVAATPAALAQARFARAAAVDRAATAELERQKLVGLAIGVIQGGEVVYTQGYGAARLQPRVAATRASVFNWASVSKPVVAVLALQLVERGKLKLDRPIGDVLPDLPARLRPITARQLLCHQSGIPHYANGLVIPGGLRASPARELDPLQALRRFSRSPLLFEPGAKYSYSSYAYVLLSAVVQAAGKQPIALQLERRITGPLKLSSFQLDVARKAQADWVSGYRLVGGEPRLIKDYAHAWKHGAGGFKSSVLDLARFAAALGRGALLEAETRRSMWTRQKTRDGEATRYGLGVQVSGSGRALKVSHNGSQDETRTRMVIYPAQGHGVVVMCNTQGANPGRISTAIYKALEAK